ncbi:MAG TPA: hypothetical protein VG963_06935, partial [Polyangiaceae bacterium]|nr:hypothetical protein [Polyangiaceae bacterium]
LGSETTGQDICRKISAQHVERPRIIAVTGYGNDGEARLRGLGFDAHVAKPFDMATLLHALCPATEVRN